MNVALDRPPAGPCVGIRVVDFSTMISGPFCTMVLGDLGADVVKVEPPRGDESRTFPPFGADGESAFFHALNRGKRGVVLEPADPRVQRLAASADVVIENLGDARTRLGFGRGDLKRSAVWCSITGHGVDRGGRAMDPSLQASMGLIALTGERDGPPLRVPVPLVDFMTGMYAVQSVLTALWHAERTGEGVQLDCALVDAAATLTSTVALLALRGHPEPGRIGSESYLAVPSAVFEAADGEHVQVVALHDRQWEALCDALGQRDWLDDPRFTGNDARVANRDLVHERVGAAIATRTAAYWVERIGAAGGMCERVRTLAAAWADPLLAQRGLVGRLEGEPLPVVSLARTAGPDQLEPSPRLGQHNDEVLGEL